MYMYITYPVLIHVHVLTCMGFYLDSLYAKMQQKLQKEHQAEKEGDAVYNK